MQSAQKMLRFPWDSPVLILEDKLPQFEVTENQSVVVAMCHSRGYLIEEPGSFVLSQLLAGTDKRVHVAIASLEEHIGPRLPKQNLQDLVNVLVLAKGEVGRQWLLVSAHIENLQSEEGRIYAFMLTVSNVEN